MKGLLAIAALTRMTTGSMLDFTGKRIPGLPHSTEHPHYYLDCTPYPEI
jgi:hypothetical protein